MIPLKKYRKMALVLVLVVVLSLVLYSAFHRESEETGLARKLVLETMSPLQALVVKTCDSVAGVWRHYVFLVGLEEENRDLRRQLAARDRDLNRARETGLESERLRRLLEMKEQAPFETVAARVVARDRTSLFRALVIDRGSRHGVTVGSPVIVAEGVVGIVMDHSWNASKVLLINDYSCRIDALLQESRVRGILEGHHDLECSLKYVSRSESVMEGDIVVTSGLAGTFPKGLVLGTVTSVVRGPDHLFQEIRVRPAVDTGKVEEVLVVILSGGTGEGKGE